MTTPIVVYGAGGHAKVVLDILRLNSLEVVAVLDDEPTKTGLHFGGCPISRASAALAGLMQQKIPAVVAIGDNTLRAQAAQRILNAGGHLHTVVHPAAVIGSDVTLGAGTVVMAGVVINAGAAIGANVILNTACSVDHDCSLGDHTHISPGAHLGGQVHVGAYTQIGIGASVLPGITIGSHVVVGGGAVVIHPIPSHAVAYGVPARVHRMKNETNNR